MSAKPPEAHLLTAAQIAGSEELPLSRPPNPNSKVYLRRLKHMSFADWVKKP